MGRHLGQTSPQGSLNFRLKYLPLILKPGGGEPWQALEQRCGKFLAVPQEDCCGSVRTHWKRQRDCEETVRSLSPRPSYGATGSVLGLGREQMVETVGLGGRLDVKIEREEKEALGVSGCLPGKRVGPLPPLVPDQLLSRA